MPNPSTLAWNDSAIETDPEGIMALGSRRKYKVEYEQFWADSRENDAKERTQAIIDDLRARNVWPYNQIEKG